MSERTSVLARLAAVTAELGHAYLKISSLLVEIDKIDERDSEDTESTAAPPTVAPSPPIAAPVPPTPPRQKTPERVALLRELWPCQDLSAADIVSRLNALPGLEIPLGHLSAYVVQWGVATTARRFEPAVPRATLADAVQQPRRADPAPPPPRPILTTPPTARAATAGISQAQHEPILATAQYIQDWGAQRGIVTGKLDLDRVNAVRRRLQLPPFEIEPWKKGGSHG
jgi:hypothetical protein